MNASLENASLGNLVKAVNALGLKDHTRRGGLLDMDPGFEIACELRKLVPDQDREPRDVGEVLAKHLPSVVAEELIKRDKTFESWHDLLGFFNNISTSLKGRLVKAINGFDPRVSRADKVVAQLNTAIA